jgi:uncharacterized OsmC-like protein
LSIDREKLRSILRGRVRHIVPFWHELQQGVDRAHCARNQEPFVKITLLSDESIRLEPVPGPMTIEAPSAEQSYSPFHMVAGGLAYCTFSVMYAWANNAELNAEDLIIDVTWTFADDPYRVGAYDIRFSWPSLPAKRLAAAKRVAELCTIHATLHHPPAITIDGTVTSEHPPVVHTPSNRADALEAHGVSAG